MWFYVGQMGSIGSALVGFQCVFQGSYVVLFLKISRHIQYSNRQPSSFGTGFFGYNY